MITINYSLHNTLYDILLSPINNSIFASFNNKHIRSDDTCLIPETINNIHENVANYDNY